MSYWRSDVCSSDLAPHPSRDRARSRGFGSNADVGHLTPLLKSGRSCRGALIGPGPYGLLTQLYYSTNSPRRREGEVMLRTMIAGLLAACCAVGAAGARSEEHTSELQSLMRISYAVFCLKKKPKYIHT